MIKTIIAAAMLAFIASASAANATPINFNLTLTSTGGTAGNGSGHLQVDGPVPVSGLKDYKIGSGLNVLDFTIDGHTFDLSEATSGASTLARFINGSLNAIIYTGLDGGNIQLTFNIGGGPYSYSNGTTRVTGTGNVTAALAPAAVPEPFTLAVFGAGLAGAAALRRRKKAA